MASVDTIVTTDRDHVWHPYSPIPGPTQHIVTAAEGPYLTLDIDARFLHEETSNGRLDCHVLDGMSSWWAAAYGYRNPTLDAAAHHQIDTFSHVMFGGLTHEPATTLAQTLLTLAPAGLSSIFFCAPMSVCDPDGGMHTLWQGVVQPQVFLPAPPVDQETSLRPAPSEISIDEYLAEAEHVLSQRADTLAACIIEPVVQGAGGMRFHQPELVRGLSELCRRYHVLVIFDEIATGFGRTGTLFAADACHCTPDIMCVGKALTGGYLTAAAVLSTRDIAETIFTGTGALMHVL